MRPVLQSFRALVFQLYFLNTGKQLENIRNNWKSV
jgi:hypothetical protein